MADLDDEVFVGRQTELNNLRAALDQARHGVPQIVVLEGPGGIGKTTLLDRFLNQESDLTVLRVSGEQWEKLLPYALLDQLARVAGNVGLLLPGTDASAAEEPITVGTRLLDLWAELQDERVVVTVIDDAHWADLDSLRAMLFAMRRLVTDRVLVVVAVRDLHSSAVPDGLRRMALGPTGRVIALQALRVNEIAQLASQLGTESLPAGTAERLHRHTEGNPLYLRAVIKQTPADAWRQWEPALPAPREYAAGVIRRMEACPPEVRAFIEAGSVLGLHFALQAAATLSRVTAPLAALDAASAAGILDTTSGPELVDVKFSHPMTRAAVYDQLPLARRAELHGQAARLVDD
jgi:predicted ATPase